MYDLCLPLFLERTFSEAKVEVLNTMSVEELQEKLTSMRHWERLYKKEKENASRYEMNRCLNQNCNFFSAFGASRLETRLASMESTYLNLEEKYKNILEAHQEAEVRSVYVTGKLCSGILI